MDGGRGGSLEGYQPMDMKRMVSRIGLCGRKGRVLDRLLYEVMLSENNVYTYRECNRMESGSNDVTMPLACRRRH